MYNILTRSTSRIKNFKRYFSSCSLKDEKAIFKNDYFQLKLEKLFWDFAVNVDADADVVTSRDLFWRRRRRRRRRRRFYRLYSLPRSGGAK